MTTPNTPPEQAPWLRLTITPEPEGDEGEALITAITAYLAIRQTSVEPSPPAAAVSRWQAAGRRSAIRGIAKSPNMGWGRDHSGSG